MIILEKEKNKCLFIQLPCFGDHEAHLKVLHFLENGRDAL